MIEKINKYCSELAESIISESYLDKNDLSVKIAIHFEMAFKDINDKMLVEKETQKNSLWRKKEFDVKYGKQAQEIQNKITILNEEIKCIKRNNNILRDYSEYSQLKLYVKNKYGVDALNDFYNALQEK